MNKQAKRYLENHFRFSGESNSNSVVVSLEENPIPTLDPVFVVPEHLVGFSDVPKRDLPLGQGHDIEAGVHFYQDDYRFNSFITRPGTYFSILENYHSIFTPDCSVFRDMEIADQVRSIRCNREIGRLMQDYGFSVIPTVSWSDERSFSYCFDGLPSDSVISVSSVGVMRDKEALPLFELGYKEMLKRLNPSLVLFYGSLPKFDLGNVPIRQYKNTNYAWTEKNRSGRKEA